MAAVRDRCLPQLSLTLHKPPILIIAPSPTVAANEDNRHHDLERIAVIGHGNGGTVYKVRHRRNNAVYALKILNSNHNGRRELEIMKRLGESEHVVRMVSSFVTSSGDLGILMEMMDAGSLDSVLRKHERLSEPAIAEIARQVLHGLAYIHSQKIAHRDIKPSNLLINSHGQIKIADFGVSKIMHRSLNTCVSYVGTCAYMSPERFDPDAHGGEYDAYAADVWSLGLTLMELHLGHFPLLPAGQRPDWSALLWAICFGDKPPVPDSASDEFKDFIECCLNREPGKRSSVLELVGHPFVMGRDLAQAGQAWMELVA